ncbi:hypothetical protein BXZ70DRAFT_1078595 [Cristinia sonorae]|uniref:Myb/SANT-like domain-containing protein n=1 Tax=Cristinia sonorae TaxID=1940300 RepID=A0A8K0ULL1_9AGAR|nr:hypothetical protein BXZ70DRAFT_1078595 [Cristinia sonorae]
MATVTRAVWRIEDDTFLINYLLERKAAGEMAANSFKSTVFVDVASKLNALPGMQGKLKTASGCRDHTGGLKSAYTTVKALRNLSGFGWDATTCTVTASEHVWDAYIARNSKAKKWKNRSFPLYDKCQEIWDGAIATGAGAFHVGVAQNNFIAPAPLPTVAASQDGNMDITPPSLPTPSSISLPGMSDSAIAVPDAASEPGSPANPVVSLSASAAGVLPSVVPTPTTPRIESLKNNKEAVGVLAISVGRVADTLLAPSADCPSTPVRRALAIETIKKDTLITTPQQRCLIRKVAENIAIGDAYLALMEPGDEQYRKDFAEDVMS